MDSASTPSSRTDAAGASGPGEPRSDAPSPSGPPSATASTHAPATPADPSPTADPGSPTHDVARRAFFRELGRSAFTTVGQVAGLADVVGRGTTAAAAGLLGIDLREPQAPARPVVSSSARTTRRPVARPPTEDQYRSPYRVTEDTIVLLDQRAMPDALEDLTCRRGTDVAYYLRTGAIRGGPLMAQVAAYGIALSARERRAQPLSTRTADLRRTRESLLSARPGSRALAWSVGRMAAIEERLGPEADGEELAAAMRAEADALALRMQADLVAVADHLATVLGGLVVGRPGVEAEGSLGILIHGNPGALWGGLVGPGVAALSRLSESGRALRIVLTEGRPFMEGARLTAWELRQAGIAHQLVADAAVGWLLERQPVDAIVIAAESVAANGDVAAVIGSRGVADLVAAARRRSDTSEGTPRPRVIVIATGTTIAPDRADGRAVPDERRPARELSSYLGAKPLPGTDAIVPAIDVIPADRVDILITERGATAPVTPEAVLGAVAD
jgi:methylthioribose-1-phosphate isomerase